MKRLLTTLLVACALVNSTGFAQGISEPRQIILPAGVDIAQLKTIGKAVIDEVIAEFAAQNPDIQVKKYAFLPLARDVSGRYFTQKFEDAFAKLTTSTGLKLLTRSDAVVAKVVSEIDFNQSYEDVMKSGSATKLNVEGADAIILPKIDIDSSPDGSYTFRASISVHTVGALGQIWGSEVSRVVAAKMTNEQLVHYLMIGLGGLAAVIILFWFLRALIRAARPR